MKEELIDHFTRQFNTLNTLFETVNAEAWTYKDQRLKGIWQWMVHILEITEYYLSGKKPEEFRFGHRFNLDWEIAEVERIPSQDEMKRYLEDVRRDLLENLQAASPENLDSRETICYWTGKTHLARFLYLLRHNQQHIGDINRVLAVCGCKALQWY